MVESGGSLARVPPMLGLLLAPLSVLFKAIPGLAGKFIDYEAARQNTVAQNHAVDVNADVSTNAAILNNYLEQQRMVEARRAADRLSPWTEWMLPALFLVCFIHFAAIVFDSIPWAGHDFGFLGLGWAAHRVGQWGIAALPAAQASIENTVLLGVAGASVGVPAIRRIFGK